MLSLSVISYRIKCPAAIFVLPFTSNKQGACVRLIHSREALRVSQGWVFLYSAVTDKFFTRAQDAENLGERSARRTFFKRDERGFWILDWKLRQETQSLPHGYVDRIDRGYTSDRGSPRLVHACRCTGSVFARSLPTDPLLSSVIQSPRGRLHPFRFSGKRFYLFLRSTLSELSHATIRDSKILLNWEVTNCKVLPCEYIAFNNFATNWFVICQIYY